MSLCVCENRDGWLVAWPASPDVRPHARLRRRRPGDRGETPRPAADIDALLHVAFPSALIQPPRMLSNVLSCALPAMPTAHDHVQDER